MNDIKVKHLEMIQGIITRMGQNSFALKGWSVALISALFALATVDANKALFLLAFLPMVVFWFLDSYYLQIERRYRVLYCKVANDNEADECYSLRVPVPDRGDGTLFFQSLFSWTEAGLYLPLMLLTAIIFMISS
ncbi:MAG: hypothetical protein LBU32_16040 [Clostridiales bacterium]|jgi:hypothetical protein|nr:hypothetical protein [Clostridiales bacterium]